MNTTLKTLLAGSALLAVAACGSTEYNSNIKHLGTSEVLFASGSSKIDAAGSETVSKVAMKLVECPAYQVELKGFTDTVGNPALNQKLSEMRVQAVADALMAGGASAEKISTAAMGEADNKVASGDGKNVAANRRVTLDVSTRLHTLEKSSANLQPMCHE